jgi:hypothetical protein
MSLTPGFSQVVKGDLNPSRFNGFPACNPERSEESQFFTFGARNE